jgi:hypothetical protein
LQGWSAVERWPLDEEESAMTHRMVGSKCVMGSVVLAASMAVASAARAQTPPPGFQPQPVYGPPPAYPVAPYYAQQMAPLTLDYDEGQPVPPGYHPVSRARKGLVVAGAVTLGSLWLLSSLTAAVAHDAGSKGLDGLYAPCVGPFIVIGTAKPNSSATLGLVIDGLAQTGGLAMLIGGIAAQQTVLVRNDAGFELRAAPMVGRGTYGLGFIGAM